MLAEKILWKIKDKNQKSFVTTSVIWNCIFKKGWYVNNCGVQLQQNTVVHGICKTDGPTYVNTHTINIKTRAH